MHEHQWLFSSESSLMRKRYAPLFPHEAPITHLIKMLEMREADHNVRVRQLPECLEVQVIVACMPQPRVFPHDSHQVGWFRKVEVEDV